MPIRYTHKEEIWNTLSHAGGILIGAIIGIVFLVMTIGSGSSWASIGVGLYLFGMLGSYIASTVYHALPARSKWKERLRRWDHAAIYWHIAVASHVDSPARTRLLGLESVLLRMAMRHCRHHCQLHSPEGTFQFRDTLFRRHGPQHTHRLQAAHRHGLYRSCHLDCG